MAIAKTISARAMHVTWVLSIVRPSRTSEELMRGSEEGMVDDEERANVGG
jgi:hypothetical protein